MRLRKLQAMDPIAFERYVGSLFADRGFRVQDTQASADEGIDLIVRQGRRMAVVQCKRYQGSVGQPVVRDLYGVMLHTGANEAYLVTTGTVTAAARRWAEGKPIHLVDQHRLVEWARTGRLNYEKPSALKTSRRQWQFFIGLVLLAFVAVALIAPQQIIDIRDAAVNAVQPLLLRLEASTPLTSTPTRPPTATAAPLTPTAAGGVDADQTATPTSIPDTPPTRSVPGGPPDSAPATATPPAVSVPTPGSIRPIFTPAPSDSQQR